MTSVRAREAALADFFARNRLKLERVVCRRIAGANEQLVEDACQIAWIRLLKRPDVVLDERGFHWLVVIATHEGWRLANTRREIPAGAFMPTPHMEPGVLFEPAGDATDPADLTIERSAHAERCQAFAQLKPRERRELYLKAAGFSYAEIAAATGSTYTAVNRRLAEGRAALRRLAET